MSEDFINPLACGLFHESATTPHFQMLSEHLLCEGNCAMFNSKKYMILHSMNSYLMDKNQVYT